jgi:hypothetical protein
MLVSGNDNIVLVAVLYVWSFPQKKERITGVRWSLNGTAITRPTLYIVPAGAPVKRSKRGIARPHPPLFPGREREKISSKMNLKSESIATDTVKASNFRHHGNLEPVLASSVASLDEICIENEQNRVCKSERFYNFRFLQFSIGHVLMIAWPSGEKFQALNVF